MRFLMQFPRMKEKGITTANSNLHPVGVYLALIFYKIRRWSLTRTVAQSLSFLSFAKHSSFLWHCPHAHTHQAFLGNTPFWMSGLSSRKKNLSRNYPPTFFLNNYTKKSKFVKIFNYDRYTCTH